MSKINFFDLFGAFFYSGQKISFIFGFSLFFRIQSCPCHNDRIIFILFGSKILLVFKTTTKKKSKTDFFTNTKTEKRTEAFVSFRCCNHRFFSVARTQTLFLADAAADAAVGVRLKSCFHSPRASKPTTKTGSQEAFLIGSEASDISNNNIIDDDHNGYIGSSSSSSSASKIIMTYTVGLHFTSTRGFHFKTMRACVCDARVRVRVCVRCARAVGGLVPHPHSHIPPPSVVGCREAIF